MSFLVWPALFAVGGGGGHPLASIFSGQQGGIWDISVTSSLYQSGTRASPGTAVSALDDPIGLILDQSGNNNDLSISSTQRPLYKPNSGLSYALFDGSNDMEGPTTFTMGTTWDRVTALQFLSLVNGACPIGGGSIDSQTFIDGSNQLGIWNNSAVGAAVGVSATTDYVVTERWKAAPSQIRLDNGSYSSSPSAAGVNPGGITFGTRRNGFNPCNMRFYGSMMYDGTLGSTDLATVVTYMGALQGRSL